jgi:prepilin-type N-terminal cleavage/methylation domain-containing protein
MLKGFSLIEVLVVVSLIAILSVFGIVNIVEFQKTAVLDAEASEFAAEFKTARENSMAGEALEGKDISYFEPGFLPYWQIAVAGNTYTLKLVYRKVGDTADTLDTVESHVLNTSWTLTPNGTTNFERINGNASGTTIYTMTDNRGEIRHIDIDSQGNINIT